jgi:hypothetical protein
MAEIVLEPPRIHSLARQRVSGRVAEHLDVNRERQLSGLASTFNHAGDTHAPKCLAPLIDKDVG